MPLPQTLTRRGTGLGALALAGLLMTSTAGYARSAPDDVAKLVATVAPAVVTITATRSDKTPRAQFSWNDGPPPRGSPFRNFYDRFFGGNGPGAPGMRGVPDHPNSGGMPSHPERRAQPPRRMHPEKALGSGFIIDAKGYVVTNNHVVAKADSVMVTLKSGKSYPAKIVGRDRKTDLALLRINAKQPLPFVSFGDSDKMRVGDWVMAIGNPFGLGGTVTTGIISARGRDLRTNAMVDFLQIDASINRGNSGGPTFNGAGKVIGVNTAIISPNGGSVGVGFAVPSNLVKRIVAQLEKTGTVTRGWLGVRIQAVTKDMAQSFGLDQPRGALVSAVVPDSPAAKAGLKSGDIVLSWDGKPVQKFTDLVRLVSNSKSGKTIDARVWRGGKDKTLAVVVATAATRTASRAGGEHGAKDKRFAAVAGAGLTLANLTPEVRSRFNLPKTVKGAVIARVDARGTAADEGLRVGDVITRVALVPVTDARDAAARIAALRRKGKAVVSLMVSRGDVERFVALRLRVA